MPLVIDSLEGGKTHTHTHIQTHMHTDIIDKSNFKKPGAWLVCAWFKNYLVLL